MTVSRAPVYALDDPSLPPYPPLPPTPCYRRNARPEETALLFGSRPPQTGIITKASKHITLALNRQPDSALDASLPHYGRAGPIDGTVSLEHSILHNVTDVHIKVRYHPCQLVSIHFTHAFTRICEDRGRYEA